MQLENINHFEECWGDGGFDEGRFIDYLCRKRTGVASDCCNARVDEERGICLACKEHCNLIELYEND